MVEEIIELEKTTWKEILKAKYVEGDGDFDSLLFYLRKESKYTFQWWKNICDLGNVRWWINIGFFILLRKR